MSNQKYRTATDYPYQCPKCQRRYKDVPARTEVKRGNRKRKPRKKRAKESLV